jgi:hypothetical protein
MAILMFLYGASAVRAGGMRSAPDQNLEDRHPAVEVNIIMLVAGFRGISRACRGSLLDRTVTGGYLQIRGLKRSDFPLCLAEEKVDRAGRELIWLDGRNLP